MALGLKYILAPSDSPSTVGTEANSADFLADSIPQHGPADASSTHLHEGDTHGIGSLLVALDAGRTRKSHHLLVPHSTVKALQPEDLNYLKEKGAFSLPTLQICNALVESYFKCVHPTTPLVDKTAFLTAYHEGGVQRVNLLLLWSMFSASASYAAEWVVQDAGYITKAQMKESFLKRAKSLFHLSGEDEKIVLIQSALLISFWFCDSNDLMQTWYWTGIAFGLAQTMGLHRNPDTDYLNGSVVSAQHRRLWRRIWWSCVIRDSWVSYLMGRPLRIHSEDCDCPMPTEADFSDDDQDTNAIKLQRLWLNLLELTNVLREVLILNYRKRVVVNATRLIALESLINHTPEVASTPVSYLLTFHRLHLELYRQVALIALFHPYCQRHSSLRATKIMAISPTVAADKVKDAASLTNEILEKMISVDGIRYFGPMTVSLLPPAMQVHLMQSKLSKSLAGQLANTKLDVCLMVLAELRDNYPSAGILHDLFTAARLDDTPLSHQMPESVAQEPSQTPITAIAQEPEQAPVQVPSSTALDAVPNVPLTIGLFQDIPQALPLDNEYLLAGFPLFSSTTPIWHAETNLALELDLNAVLSPDDLTGIFG
jgi:hypothetical protein